LSDFQRSGRSQHVSSNPPPPGLRRDPARSSSCRGWRAGGVRLWDDACSPPDRRAPKVRHTARTQTDDQEGVSLGRWKRHASRLSAGVDVGRLSLPLTVAGLATVLLASALIWLLLHEPVALADAVEQRDVAVVVEALGRALLSGLAVLFRYF
jgi:hypothetical protein